MPNLAEETQTDRLQIGTSAWFKGESDTRVIWEGYIVDPIRKRFQADWGNLAPQSLSSTEEQPPSDFVKLTEEWKRDTSHVSSPVGIAMHPSYQRIIGMGEAALSSIFSELQREPHHWFWALAAITGVNPVSPEDRGNMRMMSAAWLKWARENGWTE